MIDHARLIELCKKIAAEHDTIKFEALVLELNQLFEEQHPTKPSSSTEPSTERD